MTRRPRVALLLLVTAVMVGAAVLFLLQDANRFKPRLQAFLETQTGARVSIDGDLRWRLWPPLSLQAKRLHAVRDGEAWTAGQLHLNLDLWHLIRSARWRVEYLILNDAVIRRNGAMVEIAEARIDDLTGQRPAAVRAASMRAAALRAKLHYTGEGRAPVPVSVDGHVRVDATARQLEVVDTRIETDSARAICNGEATPAAPAGALPPATQSASSPGNASAAETETPAGSAPDRPIIPVETLRAFDGRGECLLEWLVVDGRRFEQVTVRFDNAAGRSVVDLEAPELFGGKGLARVDIDATRTPVRWVVTPNLTGVDSAELMAWLDHRMQWAAPLAYGGALTLEGNSREDLLASLSGQTHFDGGQGSINIVDIKSQLLTLAAMLGEGEKATRWPDVWEYQRFVGDWRIERQQHQLDVALDNLIVTGNGHYDPATAQLDMRLELVFQNDPTWPVFEVNPMLFDLPIPLECRGTLADPDCRLDSGAARRIVAQALASEDSVLRSGLEEKIDKEVPAEYRDAARALLDMLGGSRRGSPEPERR